jgi:hypothetical protein
VALISPASAARVSFILSLMSEWPVFHNSGVPPCVAIGLQVPRRLDVVDDRRAGHRPARRRTAWLSVRVDHVAVLRDDAEAIAVAVEREAEFAVALLQALDQVGEVLRLRRIGWWFGKWPSTSQKSSTTSQPSRR